MKEVTCIDELETLTRRYRFQRNKKNDKESGEQETNSRKTSSRGRKGIFLSTDCVVRLDVGNFTS